MLSGDAARGALEKYAASEAEQRKGIRVRKLVAPSLASEIAEAAADYSRPALAIAAKLDALTLPKREKVLAAIAPELGKDLAYWWEWSASEPYQAGWQRRAYRSADPAASRPRRWQQLCELLRHTVRYPQPLDWHAHWALHLGEWTPLGSLFASAIARGDSTVSDVLVASLRGTHPTSGPSTHAYVALLSAPDPRGWTEVEQLLVSAERSEGLRQTILETADVAHPDAFGRILDIVVDRGYARFAGTVRAVGVWIGEELGVRQDKQVAATVSRIRDELRKPTQPADLLSAEPVEAFLAVWAMAVHDVAPAIATAETLVASGDERLRLAGARLLADFQTPATITGLARAIDDPSLAVYAAATTAWRTDLYSSENAMIPMTDTVRAALHRRLDTLGKEVDVETGLIGRCTARVGSALAADLLVAHSGDRPLAGATVAAASATGRWIAAHRYAAQPATNRAALFSLLADRSTSVRDAVRGALLDLPAITHDEALLVEHALRLQASDLRTTALELLQKQEPGALQDTITRLADGTAAQRRAGEELGRLVDDAIGDVPLPAVLRYAPGERTPSVRPAAPDASSWRPYHDRCRLVWTSLTAWLAEHADVEVQTHHGVELLANVRWLHSASDQELPLRGILGPWWERIQPQLTDGGVEVALLARVPRTNQRWVVEVVEKVVGPVAREFPKADVNALQWQVLSAIADGAQRESWAEPTLRLIETVAASLPVDELSGPDEVMKRRGRRTEHDRWGNPILGDARGAFQDLLRNPRLDHAALTDEQVARLWRAYRFIDEPEGAIDRWNGPKVEVEVRRHFGGVSGTFVVPDQPDRWPAPARLLADAFARGIATRADVIDALVPVPSVVRGHFGGGQELIREVSGLRPPEWAADERLQQVVADVRAAVIGAETARGDLPSPLSDTALNLRTTYGPQQLVQCLAALGKRPFARGYLWTQSRESSLSHLIRVNQPLPGDTPDTLGVLAREVGISDARLIDTAVYAPQWAHLIEEHLDWPGLESAVWWVHAHTKDERWSVDPEIRAQWASEVSQRTPLDAVDLVNGTVDVAWFHDVIATLGEERFQALLKAAKYASSAGGHKRAELFATALLGHVEEHQIRQRITDKRNQDAVRALGLLPLDGPDVLLARYELLRAFVGSDRTSGSQRRASETTAVTVGLENLARTAGFRDPQRLIWAMEAAAIRDLADGPLSATDGDLVVTLAIDATGAPELTVQRAGRSLTSVPAKSAKIPEIADLRDRATVLRKQARRMRASLETACVRGDAFEPDEIDGLLGHPILAPMLRDLVLVDAEGHLGFPQDGTTLIAPDGTRRRPAGGLRLAHPADLLAAGEWADFQHALMGGHRRQPFKQLFRELYTLNTNERDEAGVASRRYAGHQVQARRAGGIFTSRGWVADFEQGFSRTFHEQKITAWCHLLDGWGSPTEVEDATIGDVTFHPAGTWKPLPLAEVPVRVFSEAMRDLDLVVSVAHASGVDPIASESSVEMRGRLVDETAELLGLTNVEVGGHHVRVKGALGTYSVHLGSGVVHRVPGNAVCIVPVSAQHRGRIFLPFADDDPRTAEIVAKVVLLARDDRIKDPTILQQLVG